MYTERYKRAACLLLSVFLWGKGTAQQPLRFSMETLHDSLSWLCLRTERKGNRLGTAESQPA